MRCALLLLALGCLFAAAAAQQCLDESGQPVDWWMIVKIPRETDSSDPGVSSGTAYLYADAQSYQTPAAFWTNSSHQISDASSAAGLTVQQIYDNAGNTDTNGYLMYNDETPSGTTSMSYGHTKGFMAWSVNSSFWLIHSVPKYADSPDNVQSYTYPSTGEMYGQSMLCMSLTYKQIDQAFLQMQYTNPQVYGSQWVPALSSQMPNGNAFVNSGSVVSTASSNVVNVTTVGGVSFTHFAKTVAWGKSIYGDLIGPFYGQSMVVETWQRPYEDPLLPPQVQEAVYSVLDLQAPDYAAWDGVTWKMSQDHAKWGIVTDRSMPVFCIGDINKQVTQWKRSGGLACIMDNVIHQAFLDLIVDTDENSTAIALE
jgi:deoxyribonuclease-2